VTISNLGHCENGDEYRHIWPCVQSCYKPTSLHDNQQQNYKPQKSTMPECPPSGSHIRFHWKPSTSIESQETRKLKCEQCLLAYEKRSRPLSKKDEKWWFQRLGLGCKKRYMRARFKGKLCELAIRNPSPQRVNEYDIQRNVGRSNIWK
jgi:hypothetical protein